MRQYSPERLDRFKSAFEKYMDAYMTRRDLGSLREMGTTFKIFLPAAELVGASTDESPWETTPSGGDETILVVDDEQEIRALTEEALGSFGYVVKSAATGEEALQVYQESGEEIDLVLLDLNMPGMGGHKCLQELLQLDPSVKVVIASGYPEMHFGKNTIASDAKGFISKPYQLTELEAKVREVLSG